MSSIPAAYLRIVEPLIETARGFLEEGESLVPFAFVGNLTAQTTVPVMLKAGSEREKDDSAAMVKQVAAACEADFVFVVMEAWSLRPDQVHRYQELLERYGSIGASPYAVDVATFTLETRHGIWVAQVPIEPKGDSKGKRTFESPSFQLFTQTQGRFVDLLPATDGAKEPRGTLH